MFTFICNYILILLNTKNTLINFEILSWFGFIYPLSASNNFLLLAHGGLLILIDIDLIYTILFLIITSCHEMKQLSRYF